MSDLIERQAVLTMLDDIMDEVMDGEGYRYGKWSEYVEQLPAQPEIIRCKDCKLYGDEKCLMNFDGYDWAEPEGYCQAAERRGKWMT